MAEENELLRLELPAETQLHLQVLRMEIRHARDMEELRRYSLKLIDALETQKKVSLAMLQWQSGLLPKPVRPQLAPTPQE